MNDLALQPIKRDNVGFVNQARERVFKLLKEKSSVTPEVVCRRFGLETLGLDDFNLDLALTLKLESHFPVNSPASATFTVHMFTQPYREEEDFIHEEPSDLLKEEFVLEFEGQAVWRNEANGSEFSDDELASYVIETFLTERQGAR